MKTVGIIAEYNPIHLGHCLQMEHVRKNLGANYIVVAMSGDYVQRGVPALFPKHLRAKAALLCGADLVLELPVSVATASAELFARGGVALLDKIGVIDSLCFGSESGKDRLFMETAQILLQEPAPYQNLLKANLKSGMNFPTARSHALLQYLSVQERNFDSGKFSGFLSSPNNILGIEYCKAILSLNSSITPVPLLREGAGYHDTDLSFGKAPSASGIRQLIKTSVSSDALLTEGTLLSQLKVFMPQPALPLFMEALFHKRFLTEEDFDSLLHYCLLSLEPEEMWQYLDVSKELADRITKKLAQYQGFLSFAALLKTKEITHTRIQRALLHILLQIKSTPVEIPYARVLGFRKTCVPLLKEIKEKGQIPLVTSLSSSSRQLTKKGKELLNENTYVSNVYESLLCKKEGRPFCHEYTKPVIVL